MVLVSEGEAALVLCETFRGQPFDTGAEKGTVDEVDFYEPPQLGQPLQLHWRINTGTERLWIRASYMTAEWDDLRRWCAEHYGVNPLQVRFWLEV